MEGILRDPIWQGIAAIVAIGATAFAIIRFFKLDKKIREWWYILKEYPTLIFVHAIVLLMGIVIGTFVALRILPTRPQSSTITASECRLGNLLTCAVPTSVYISGESLATAVLASGKLAVEFDNKQKFSGVAFQFTPALDVRGFSHIELTGTSSQAFKFLAEYKINSPLSIVTKSTEQSFPATTDKVTIKIPIAYDGRVDEIVINFFATGESSKLVIESIRLIY